MYPVLDIARYIVDYCYNQGKPISNLKLQKMLYLIWIDFYKETGEYLFKENIYAWKYGPVVPEVYYEFCVYGGMPIYEEVEINPELKKCKERYVIQGSIDNYIKDLPYDLVSRTHQKDMPWDKIYNKGEGANCIIPFSLIKKLECSNGK